MVTFLIGCQSSPATPNSIDGSVLDQVMISDGSYFDAVETVDGGNSVAIPDAVDIAEPDVSYADVRGQDGLFNAEVRQLVAAVDVTCAVLAAGEVYCWGFDGETNDGKPREVLLRPRRIDGFRNIVNMASSASAACGADQQGSVWCLGFNGGNTLATGSLDEILRRPGRRMDVEAGSHLAWMGIGSNLIVQRLDGTLYIKSHLAPANDALNLALPSPVIAVDANAFSYCALLRDQRMFCWGNYISDRQPWPFSEGPRLVSGLDGVAEIAVGYNYYCVLKRDATVWCWGVNDVGQTGTPPEQAEQCSLGRTNDNSAEVTVSCVRQPRRVLGLTDVAEIQAGDAMTCARKRDGTVWCWGDNSRPFLESGSIGRIGDGQPNTEQCAQTPWSPVERTPPPVPCRRLPTRVVGLTGVSHLSLGSGYACAARADGQIWCWGRNITGALGDGTRTTRLTPVPVVAPF